MTTPLEAAIAALAPHIGDQIALARTRDAAQILTISPTTPPLEAFTAALGTHELDGLDVSRPALAAMASAAWMSALRGDEATNLARVTELTRRGCSIVDAAEAVREEEAAS